MIKLTMKKKQRKTDSEKRARDSMVTSMGTLRGRYHVRAICQTVAFVCLVGGYCLVNLYNLSNASMMESSEIGIDSSQGQDQDQDHRRLQEEIEDPCDDLKKADPGWLCAFYGLGVLYMFLALAIVCDEFFVPALEEMSCPRRLNLSMDVAGATLMAAGGSAPELFTSLFGTFQESDIGFGTIVGSAVFNVLFVIAMCSLLTKEVLHLTWWPLFRDSSYYAIGLVVLCIFTGVVSPGEIELWEAIVLFAMYLGYILIMWQNANIYKKLTGKVLEYPEEDDDDNEAAAPKSDVIRAPLQEAPEAPNEEVRPPINRISSKGSVMSNMSVKDLATAAMGGVPVSFRWQGTFRAGILKLLRDPNSWADTAGVGIVAKISGDADYVFSQVDIDGNGHVDREELKQLFNLLECYVSPVELEEVFNQLDVDKDGTISQKEFTAWYCRSEERILSQVRHVFDSIDVDKSNTIDKAELKTLLAVLDPHVTDEDVSDAVDAMYKHGSRDEITFDEFSDWYKKSIIYERQKKQVEEDMEGAWENLMPPKEGGCMAWTWYIVALPLVVTLTFTIPDVRRPGLGRWCYFAFFMSIAWIGLYAFLMVTWTEIIGNTIGIPSVVMGLTVLAAGTSVPDLLSSVIVARRGSGDMAVSSSIGSNIFDILVGLPIPWILFTVWPTTGDTVYIGADNIFISLFVLLGMLVFVIGAVHCQGWRLTKALGGMMLVFYVLFLVQAIVLELPFTLCT